MKKITEELVSPADRQLLQLVLADQPGQEAVDAFLPEWASLPEDEGRTLLLACFVASHPEFSFPDTVKKQVRAASDRRWLHNMHLLTQFRKLSGSLRRAGIPVTLFKGGAMKFLQPSLPRPMSDIDVIVPEQDYARAAAIIRDLGYRCSREHHSFDVHLKDSADGLLDVHRHIPLLSRKEKAIMPDLLSRAREISAFGSDVSVLCEEDLVFTLLVNLTRNLRGFLFAFSDVHCLLGSKPDFDWSIVVRDAHRSGSERLLLFAIRVMNDILPGFLPEVVEVPDREMEDLEIRVHYVRDVLYPLQQRSHQLGVGKVLRNPRLIPEFLKVRPRYSFLKLFRSCPTLSRRLLYK